MAVTVRSSVFSVMVAALAAGITILGQPDSDPPEIRALWVDAFHAGIRSRAEIQELIAAAQRAHLNTLFVQSAAAAMRSIPRGSNLHSTIPPTIMQT